MRGASQNWRFRDDFWTLSVVCRSACSVHWAKVAFEESERPRSDVRPHPAEAVERRVFKIDHLHPGLVQSRFHRPRVLGRIHVVPGPVRDQERICMKDLQEMSSHTCQKKISYE